MFKKDFAKIYDWEISLMNKQQTRDIAFWGDFASSIDGQILEIGAGTGRITIPLLEQKNKIFALDNSDSALNQLRKHQDKYPFLKIVKADMSNFNLSNRFKATIIGYSSFQHLETLEEELSCLKTIHKHLETGGLLGIDINPVICDGQEELQKAHLYTEFCPQTESVISMYTSYKTDLIQKIRTWNDLYISIDPKGRQEQFTNKIILKECNLDYMRLLLSDTGFEIVEVYGSFDKTLISQYSQNIIYICRKK